MAKTTAATQTVATDAKPVINPEITDAKQDTQTDAAADAKPEQPKQPEPLTNAKIVALQTEQADLETLLPTLPARSPEQRKTMNRIIQIDTDIIAEQANIKNEIAAAIIAENRSKTVDLVQSVIDLYNAEKSMFAEFEKLPLDADGKRDETATNEMNAATAAAKNAFETVLNRLLGKPAKLVTIAAATGEQAATDGDTNEYWKKRENILAQHVINKSNGMDDTASNKQIQSLGAKRSTVWFAIDAYNKQPK
jgi:hypothetical protein